VNPFFLVILPIVRYAVKCPCPCNYVFGLIFRIRNEELSRILSLVSEMCILPESIGVLSHRFPPNAPWIKSSKCHIFILYPRLIDLICVLAGPAWLSDDLGSDVALVNLTRECLRKISSELCISA
jgi:hypothetical protein